MLEDGTDFLSVRGVPPYHQTDRGPGRVGVRPMRTVLAEFLFQRLHSRGCCGECILARLAILVRVGKCWIRFLLFRHQVAERKPNGTADGFGGTTGVALHQRSAVFTLRNTQTRSAIFVRWAACGPSFSAPFHTCEFR